MISQIEKAIEALAGQVKSDTPPDHALKLTQAVSNLSHALGVLAHRDRKD